MATVNFIYRSSKENAPLTARLLFRYEDENQEKKDFTIDANSGICVYDKDELIANPLLNGKHYWTKQHKAQRLKDIEVSNKRSEILSKLNKLENVILKEFEKIEPQQANKEWLESIVSEYHNPNTENEIPNTLTDFIDYYLEMNTHLKYGTSKKFITLKNKIIERKSKFSKGGIILLSEIDDIFKKKYSEIFKDYSINTVNRDLTNIKTLLRYADAKGKEVTKDALNWKMKVKKTPFIYLTEEEINIINELQDLPEYLENTKDWLVISCLCGQRVSDFMRFEKSMIRKEKNMKGQPITLIEFTQVKTQTNIAVPLHKTILEILKKRNGEFPRAISSQKYNDYVKEVCKEAGLTEKVRGNKITIHEDGSKRTENGTFEKWELVSSHVGRRSFATNNYGRIPTSLIMSATGHTTEKMFLAYIQKSQTDQAIRLADYF